MFGYTLSFSETPDGTHQGGAEYLVNVARVGTPGTTGATVTLTYSQTTPKTYIYAAESARVGIQTDYAVSATRSFRATMFYKVVSVTYHSTAEWIGLRSIFLH